MVRHLRVALPLVLLGTFLALGLAQGDDERGSGAQAPAVRPAPPASVTAEIALTASEARWRPRKRGGRLTLSGVSPRMAVMATAPRREIAVMPVSMLRANWNALFASSARKTNIVLAGRLRDRAVLIPLRAKLVKSHVSGERLVFDVGVLRRVHHKPDRLPPRPTTIEDPTILVDPTITDAIKAMWASIVNFFAGTRFSVPPDPTSTSEDGNTLFYDDGADIPGGDVYHGPSTASMTNAEQWEQVQRQVFDEAGPYRAFEFNGNPFGQVTFNASSYDGLAIFRSPNDYQQIIFDGAPRVVVENSAVFGVNTDAMRFTDADIGGMNMRGTRSPGFYVENTLFQTVDMTGDVLGGVSAPDGPRSSVVNSAFVDVRANLSAEGPDGNPDPFNDRTFNMNGIDFESVTFVDSAFPEGQFRDATFQGCGFQNVDFSGATFVGNDPSRNDNTFQPTFDNSIMEGVNFNEARFQDVSFAGVDFSGGNVSFDGARLNNVDFTGATGLQFIDWTRVTVEGPVYGIAQFAELIGNIPNRDDIRTITFDGVVPEIDPDTGFDVEPGTGYLIDTDTGVRLERDSFSGRLIPIDPATGEPMRNPNNGNQLIFEPGGVFDPATNESFEVDYATGRLEGE